VDGLTPLEASGRLHEAGVVAPSGSFYALEAARHSAAGEQGGVRVGISAYTDEEEIDRLLTALAGIVST
jgi:selenocysteine lyase/cysteine desulfurase